MMYVILQEVYTELECVFFFFFKLKLNKKFILSFQFAPCLANVQAELMTYFINTLTFTF